MPIFKIENKRIVVDMNEVNAQLDTWTRTDCAVPFQGVEPAVNYLWEYMDRCRDYGLTKPSDYNELWEKGVIPDSLDDEMLSRLEVILTDWAIRQVGGEENLQLKPFEIEPLELPDLPRIKIGRIREDSQRRELRTESLDAIELPIATEIKSIPDEVVEELLSYKQGAFSNTLDNAERINELHSNYGTPALTTADDAKHGESLLTDIIQDLFNESRKFENRELSTSKALPIYKAIDHLRRADNEGGAQALINAQREFEETYEYMDNWYRNSWVGGGGTPDNHNVSKKKRAQK